MADAAKDVKEKMGILTLMIVGLIAGVLAKLIMPGDDPGDVIVTILIRIVGDSCSASSVARASPGSIFG